jgi:hypothetical protein
MPFSEKGVATDLMKIAAID